MIKNLRYLCTLLLLWVAGVGLAQDNVVEISTVDQLKAFRDAVNSGNNTYAGKTVKLTANLDLSGESNWTPIGNLVAYPTQSFNGTFDGDGHSISNVTVNDNTPNHAVAGLFGSVVNGTIKNLTVKNVNLTSTHYAGGIVAYTSNGPTIENCHVIGGTIKSTPEIVNGSYDNGDKIGGIMGYATAGSTINNCTVEGVTLSAYRDFGGIVGFSAGTVSNNTVKNVTLIQDLTNGYKDSTPTTIGDIIGRDDGATLSNNIVIKSDPVAQIGETKYETLAEAVAAANAGDVIEVIKAGDYKLPNLPKNVTIEGKADGVVSFTHTTAGSVASIPNGATFKNVAFNFGNVNYHGFQHAGTINMEGCTLNGKFFSYGDMNFTNCQFVQTNSDYHMWCYSGNTTYTGCTFTNSVTGKFLNVYNESGATKYTVTVNNCKFVNNASTANKAALNVKATSGSNVLAYDVIINNCTTEGAFPEASESQALVVLNNLVQVDDRTANGVDNITVTQDSKKIYPVNYVAQIGETKYETLAEAVAAAKSGDTIKLLADLENTGNVSLPAGVTLDGDGKNIIGNSAIYINANGGTVQNVNFKNIHNSSSKLSAIYATGEFGGTVTVTGCTFDNCDWDAIQITPVAGANVVITNNTFSDDTEDGIQQQRYIHVQSAQNVDFSATITENVMPGKLTQEPIGVYYPTDKSKIDLTKNYIESINDVCILVADNNGYAGELVFPAYTTAEKQETYSPVAMIQNGSYAANFYAKLQDAIDAGEGKTVKLLADINLGSGYSNINKAVTINGDGHTITSSAAQAVMLSGNGAVTISNTKITATNGHGIQAGNDNAAYAGALTLNEGSVLTVAKRGIRIYKEDTGLAINVDGSTIQSNKQDPKTTYTTGDEAMGLSLGTTDGKGYDVTINNSIIQGFSYDISVVTSGSNLNVNMMGGETYGRAILNVWGDNNNFNLNGVTVHGLNNETGPQEAYSCIVENNQNGVVAEYNTYTIQDCQFIATLSEAAMTAEGSTATEQMIDLRGTNSTVKVLGSTTYTCNSNERGGLVYNEGALFTNKLYFDDTTKATFADAFKEAVIADEKDAEVGLYPVTYTPEVYYYWFADGAEQGVYTNLATPFTEGWLDNGEYIRLNKNIELTANLTWAKENASFTMTFGDFKVTKGEFSIALKQGVTVNTDKQTNIFSAVDAGFKVVETAVEGGYTYTVVAKEYVAQIGEEQKYYSLAEAFEAATDGQTITVLTDIDLPSTIAVTKQVTLDLDGKTISNTSDLWVGGNWSFFSVQANGNLTVTGNGTIDAKENDCYTFDVRDGGILTIKDGTFTGNISCVYLYNKENIGVSTCNIEGGTFSIKQLAPDVQDDKYRYLLNCLDASYTSNTAKFNVTGGSFVNFNPANNLAEGAATNFCAAGYEAVQNGDIWTVQRAAVAKIGETPYYSLADAVAAVPADGAETTITMIANEMINVVGSAITIPTNKNVVIDLNGFQVVGTAEGGSTSALITNKGTLTIKDSSDTNKDGTGTGKLISGATTTWIYDGGDDYSGSYASNTITNSGTLTIESGYVENLSTGSATYAVDNNSSGGNAILNVNGGLLKARSVAVRQFANSTTLKNEVNVAGGTVTAGKSGIWIQLPGSDATKAMKASLNVTGGTLTGEYAFYDYSYGNLYDATQYNLSGGTFNGGIFSYGANITISDGEYNSWIAIKQAKPSNVAVTGGKFADDVYTYGANASEGFITGGVFASTTYENEGNTYNYRWLNCLADGYVPAENTDPETMEAYPYAVRQANYICAIDETKYETLQAAINACEAGTETTIKLLDNVTDGAGFAIPDGVTNKNIIIDFDGKSYNVTKGAVGSTGTTTQAMHFYSGNTLTLKNGTITSAATSEENKLKMMMQNYCDLTLDGMTIDCSNINGGTYGTFTGADAYWSNKSVPVFNFNTGNATIKNTTVTFRDGDNMGLCVDGGTVALGEGAVINGPVSAVTGTVTITDGKYSGAVTADQATVLISGGVFAVKPADEYCAQDYVVTDNTDEATKDQYPFTVKTNEEAGIFILYDKEPYKYVDVIPASEVTYVRSFGTTNVQSWYVPFDYTITEEDANNFLFYKIHMIAASGDQQGGDVSDNTKVYIYIEPLAAGTLMKANRPYVIKAKNTVQNYEFIAKNIDNLYKTDDTSRLHNETTEFTYDFYGTYKSVFCDDDLHWIAISGGKACPIKANTELKQYRWYIKIAAKQYHDDYAKMDFIFVEGDGETDGVNNAQTIDGEIEGIYTLGGMKVEHPVKGVNIIKYTDGRTKKINVK